MKVPRKNRRIRPRYQREFIQWFGGNQSRFILPAQLVKRTKINVDITVPGLTPLISFGLASNALMVWVNNKDGENFGILADLDIAPKKRGRGFINSLCLPEDQVTYPNLASLRRAEIYESFLEWVNQKLANATWINLVQSKGGSVGTDLVYRDSGVNQSTHDIRHDSALVVPSKEYIFDPERDQIRTWLYPVFPENYDSGISHLNFALEQGDLKTKVLNRPHKATNIVALPTWFDDLERMTLGFQAGQLTVVAGRPAMGKTAFALNIAAYVALNRELPVGIFSLENTGENLAVRLVSSVGRVSALCMETDNLNDNEWSRISSAIGQLTESYIFYDDTKGSCLNTINAGAQRLSRCWGDHLGLVIIDCIQLIDGNKQGNSGENDIAEIMHTLKSIAQNLSVPVLALSRLPEEVDMRKDKRPTLSDLGEKGAIEQQADLVLMLYRDEYYDPDTPDKGLAEVIIRKSNNASDGTLTLAFNSEYGCFENLP